MQNEEQYTTVETEDSLKSKGFRVKSLKPQPVQMSPGAPGPVERTDGLISQALAAGRTMDEIQALINMRNAEIARVAKLQFMEAMARFQDMVPPVKKNGRVDYEHSDGKGRTTYEYSTLGGIKRAIAKPASECGFSHRWETRYEGSDVIERTILNHIGGHSEFDEFRAPYDKSGNKAPIQAMKSTISYLRRAGLESVYGLVTEGDGEDDDGRAAYQAPQVTKLRTIKANTPEWNTIVQAYARGQVTIDELEKMYNLSPDQYEVLKGV